MAGAKETTYLRLPAELKQRVETFAAKRDYQAADAIAELLDRGLEYDELTARLESLRDGERKLQDELGKEQFSRQLEVFNRSMAENKLGTAQRLINELYQFLAVPVATCKYCGAVATVQDVVTKHCSNPNSTPQCQQGGFDLLQDYKGEMGAWEILKGISTVVGGIVIAKAVGEALTQGAEDRDR